MRWTEQSCCFALSGLLLLLGLGLGVLELRDYLYGKGNKMGDAAHIVVNHLSQGLGHRLAYHYERNLHKPKATRSGT